MKCKGYPVLNIDTSIATWYVDLLPVSQWGLGWVWTPYWGSDPLLRFAQNRWRVVVDIGVGYHVCIIVYCDCILLPKIFLDPLVLSGDTVYYIHCATENDNRESGNVSGQTMKNETKLGIFFLCRDRQRIRSADFSNKKKCSFSID